jgi:hypothetical protein
MRMSVVTFVSLAAGVIGQNYWQPTFLMRFAIWCQVEAPCDDVELAKSGDDRRV